MAFNGVGGRSNHRRPSLANAAQVDWKSDEVRIDFQDRNTAPLATLALTCTRDTLAATVLANRSITALRFYVNCDGVQLDALIAAFDVWEFRDTVLELPALRVVVFQFAHIGAMLRLLFQHLVLREALPGNIVFRFVCKRTEEHGFLEVRGGEWVGLDPTSKDVETTGARAQLIEYIN